MIIAVKGDGNTPSSDTTSETVTGRTRNPALVALHLVIAHREGTASSLAKK